MSQNTNQDRVYFDNLDIFRFIAAMMVVLVHTFEGWYGWTGGYPEIFTIDGTKELNLFGKYFANFMNNLGYGVDVFFLISGFLITYLLLKEKSVYGKINIKKFYLRRILRIWPLYYLAIALTPFLIQWLGDVYKSPDYLPNLLYYNNFATIVTQDWQFPYAHFWSLCVEEHFYVIWPLVIAYIPLKKLPTVFSLLIVGSMVFRAYAMLTMAQPYFPIYLNTISRADALVIGAFFAYWHFVKPIQLKINAPIRFSLYLMLLFLLIFDQTYNVDALFLAVFKKYFYLFLTAFAMGNYMFNPEAFLVFRKKNIFHYFGKISYGIYVYHNMIIPVIFLKIMFNNNIHSIYFYVFAMIGGTILLAVISYELYEKWFLKIKDRFTVIKTR